MEIKILNKLIEKDILDKELVEKKIHRLEKYFNSVSDPKIKVVFKQYRSGFKVEINYSNALFILRAETFTNDYLDALDTSIRKIEDQLRRQKTRMSRKNHESFKKFINFESHIFEEFESTNGEDIKITREKSLSLTPMDIEEAQMQIDLIDHDFFAFLNSENNKINILYKKNNNEEYGLIVIE